MLAAAVMAVALASSPALPGVAQERDFIYCTGFDASADRHYYSAVFVGDYLQNQQYAQRFTAHLRGRYGADLPTSYCFYEERRGDAQVARDNAAALKRTEGKRVVFTDWFG
jgi:hypothetical protein